MFLNRTTRLSAASIVMSIGLATAATAASLQISITNNQAEDGVYLTPLASILHDGSFDTFDSGGQNRASDALEALAEDGNADPIVAAATAAGADVGVITSPGGFPGAPVIDPGETASIELNVADPTSNRFFSFLSMVIPSNDVFIGNEDSMAYEVFDIAGAFTGLGPIQVYSNQAYSAGTEENIGFGAPFNTASGDGDPVETDDPIRRLGNLFFLNGQNTPDGTTINLSGRTLLATIEISEVPLPAGFPLLIGALGAFGLMKRRKR